MKTLRVLLGEAIFLVAANLELLAIHVGGETFALLYIASAKERCAALRDLV